MYVVMLLNERTLVPNVYSTVYCSFRMSQLQWVTVFP